MTLLIFSMVSCSVYVPKWNLMRDSETIHRQIDITLPITIKGYILVKEDADCKIFICGDTILFICRKGIRKEWPSAKMKIK